MSRRSLDLSLVLDGWAADEPSAGFADRVLAAYDKPAVAPRRKWPLYALAVAAACVLLPILATPRPPAVAPVVAHGPDYDLGQQTD